MAEDKSKKEDDIRARFAALEAATPPPASHDELPPVPDIAYERPGKKENPRTVSASDVRPAGIGLVRPLQTGGVTGDTRGVGQAMSVGTSLVASIIVGTLLGWLVDKYLLHSGTGTPWGLIIGFMIGVASGFVNLIRVSNEINRDDSG